MHNNPKDKLYYDDLIYELKKICGFFPRDDEYFIEKETEERIFRRKNDIQTVCTKGSGQFKTKFRMSIFNRDVLHYLRKIQDIAYEKGKNTFYMPITTIEGFRKMMQFGFDQYNEIFFIIIDELEEKKRNAKQQEATPKRH